MSVLAPTLVPSHVDRPAPSFGRRIAERRRLAQQDRINAQLGELHAVGVLLADAATVVAGGWIQHGWFAYQDEQGRQHLVGAHNLQLITGRQLTGACLVGAIVHAGGGVPAARTQPVHRALDLTWQALFGVPQPVGSCPAPALRVARVRDLTLWNDSPRRTAPDVTTLLGAAAGVAAGQLEQVSLGRATA